jgi:transaldolase
MKLFLDTANLDEIREIRRWGVLSGLTSNPTLIAKEAPGDIETYMKELCAEVDGPVSLETTELESADTIFEQGMQLAQVAPNAVVKVAMTPDGLAAGKRLIDQGVPVNVTLTFSPAQAILAAEIDLRVTVPRSGG